MAMVLSISSSMMCAQRDEDKERKSIKFLFLFLIYLIFFICFDM